MWDQVHEYLKDSLDRDGGIDPFSLGLSVRERSQVERGGIYTIPETYLQAADLLPASSLDGQAGFLSTAGGRTRR